MVSNAETKRDQEELLQLVSFKIGDEEFGVDILSVQEINRMSQITKVPNTPDFIEGVINLRGRIIPVIDLRVKLGMTRKDHGKNTRIVVVELKGQTIGFIVCLLYTSDAADERSSVDLGGRRIIKKKKSRRVVEE